MVKTSCDKLRPHLLIFVYSSTDPGRSDGSVSNPRSDGKCKRGTREESKEHCMIQAMDKLASEGALDGNSVGSVID